MKILLFSIFIFYIGYEFGYFGGRNFEKQNQKFKLNNKINNILISLNKRDKELNRMNKQEMTDVEYYEEYHGIPYVKRILEYLKEK